MARRPKLTPDQVRELRAWARVGRNQKAAAAYFGVQSDTLRVYLRRQHKTVR